MKRIAIGVFCLAVSSAWAQSNNAPSPSGDEMKPTLSQTETATFAAGCFWCIEEIFRQQPGVVSVTSGFTGGTVKNPTYAQVCTGDTGHAEAIQIVFDPQKISYEKLLEVFWSAHDPTTLNRQGADVGTQYRSAIFTHSDAQMASARASLAAEERSRHYPKPIVTEITPATEFYSAEKYHQDYYLNNKRASYCRFVIRPKLKKLGLED